MFCLTGLPSRDPEVSVSLLAQPLHWHQWEEWTKCLGITPTTVILETWPDWALNYHQSGERVVSSWGGSIGHRRVDRCPKQGLFCGPPYTLCTIFLPRHPVSNFFFLCLWEKVREGRAGISYSPKQVPTQKHNCPFNKQVFLEFLSSNEITWFTCSKHFFFPTVFPPQSAETRLLEKLKLSLKFSHAGYKSWVGPAQIFLSC